MNLSLALRFGLSVLLGLGLGPARAQGPSLITGSFFQIQAVGGWVAPDWTRVFARMKAARISDHVIWQWTSRANPATGTFETYYPTRMAGFSMKRGLASLDPVEDSLARAAAAGMQVWLGLCWSDEWWTHYGNDKAWLEAQAGHNTATAAELWSRYGARYRGTIAGFYLPMEVDNDNFPSPAQQANLTEALATICAYVHGNCGGKPVMTAPFCKDTGAMSRAAWTTLWMRILARAPLDVIALQDGNGASDDGGLTTHTTLATAPRWFEAIQTAIDAVHPGTQLWSDLETYRMNGSEENCVPATQRQIEAQIASQRGHVKRFTSFSTLSFQDPAAGHAREYKAYRNFARRQQGTAPEG